MSGGIPALELSEDDLRLMLVADVYVGTPSLNHRMAPYVHSEMKEENYIIKPNKTWEKILLAARAICAIENPSDVYAIGCKPFTQRAVLKFAQYTRASSFASRFTPGAFTNQIQTCFREPRLLVVSDPKSDHQAILESSSVNIPVIAFCSTDSPLSHVDIVIPCNNTSANSIAVVWWMLAREVRRMRGEDVRTLGWNVMVDMFRYRDPVQEQQEVEEDEGRVEQVIPGAELDAAEPWSVDPSLPMSGLGEMGVPGAGFGPVGTAAAGGWSNLDADPRESW